MQNKNCRKLRFKKEQRRLLRNFKTKKSYFFNKKYFVFYKYICEIYILADIK